MPGRGQVSVGGGFLDSVRESVRTGFWFIPGLFAAAAIVGALSLVQVDRWRSRRGGTGELFGGGFDSASQLLAAIVSSTMAFTVLTFSITVVALQLASSQFSPRILRTFLRDRGSQVPLGVFIATFVFSLLVLRTIRSGDGPDDPFVPGISVVVAIGLAVTSVLAFVYYVNHVAHGIRAVTIMDSVAGETRRAIEANYPERDERQEFAALPDEQPAAVLHHRGDGAVLVAIDHGGLVSVARHHDAVIELLVSVGDYVHHGAPIARVRGGDGGPGVEAIGRRLSFGSERSTRQDVAFGLRQLVDMAEKALSPGINDPTTAVQVIGRIEDVLARIALRQTPSGRYADADGVVRLAHPVPTWEQMVELAFTEIRHYGADSIQVLRRLRAALVNLAGIVPLERRPALEAELRLLDEATGAVEPHERPRARAADRQGLGAPHARSS